MILLQTHTSYHLAPVKYIPANTRSILPILKNAFFIEKVDAASYNSSSSLCEKLSLLTTKFDVLSCPLQSYLVKTSYVIVCINGLFRSQ